MPTQMVTDIGINKENIYAKHNIEKLYLTEKKCRKAYQLDNVTIINDNNDQV
jgi:hypothetical protein